MKKNIKNTDAGNHNRRMTENNDALHPVFFSVYLSLGTNLGDKRQNLESAIRMIEEKAGAITSRSSIYKTEPWGFESEYSFLNMAVQIKTRLTPDQLLQITQIIEKDLGRANKSSESYQDRIIDIDIILYDCLIIHSPQLIIPHPHFHERKFVLEPLSEINPELVHPILNKTIKQLLNEIDSCS